MPTHICKHGYSGPHYRINGEECNDMPTKSEAAPSGCDDECVLAHTDACNRRHKGA